MESRQADIDNLKTDVDHLGMALTILRRDLASLWRTTNALGEGGAAVGSLRSRTQELSDSAKELLSRADRIGESQISAKVDSMRQSEASIWKTVENIETIARMNRRKAIVGTVLVILGIAAVAILLEVVYLR
jgi:hypothetical protein